MRELESTLQQFGEFLLKARFVNEKAAPHCVRWVRRFLQQPASVDSLADRTRPFYEELERRGCRDWQVRQAETAIRVYFVNFLLRTDWEREPPPGLVDEQGRVDPVGVPRTRAAPHQNEALLLPHRVQLRRLGPSLCRLRRQSTGGTHSAYAVSDDPGQSAEIR
jgi:hypothetical protein